MATIGELRGTYSYVHKEYNSKKYELGNQLDNLKEKITNTENGQELYGEQAAILELQYAAVSDKQKIYDDFIQSFMEKWQTKLQLVADKQNADSAGDAYEDIGKILEVARRLCRGDIVPASDEKKLMDYDKDLYQMAKNAQMMAQIKERKKHDSLWDDEKKTEQEDPMEAADAQEIDVKAPEIVSVDQVIAEATPSDV